MSTNEFIFPRLAAFLDVIFPFLTLVVLDPFTNSSANSIYLSKSSTYIGSSKAKFAAVAEISASMFLLFPIFLNLFLKVLAVFNLNRFPYITAIYNF